MVCVRLIQLIAYIPYAILHHICFTYIENQANIFEIPISDEKIITQLIHTLDIYIHYDCSAVYTSQLMKSKKKKQNPNWFVYPQIKNCNSNRWKLHLWIIYHFSFSFFFLFWNKILPFWCCGYFYFQFLTGCAQQTTQFAAIHMKKTVIECDIFC